MTVPMAPQHIGQLLVREPIELAENEEQAKTFWQILHRTPQQHGAVRTKHDPFLIRHGLPAAVLFFVEYFGRSLVTVVPLAAGAPNDRQKPGAPVASRECSKVAKGP